MKHVACLGAALVAAAFASAATVRPQATDEALVNPGMGMVYYHYSNRLWAYGMYTKPGDVLDWFPGTSTVYLRVLWNDVEPKEGQFNWDIFDSLAQNWIAAGKKIAFRIICCNQTENATPDWVREAGAKGIWFDYVGGKEGIDAPAKRWEPTYDDPVFLEKLENFLRAFAARYDGDPSVAFVDVGSFGMYGEGHTGRTCKLSPEETARIAKLHMELHLKCLPRTYFVISDDVAGSASKDPKSPLMEWAHARGIGFRDDSLMCSRFGWYHAHWGRNAAAHRLPVVLETGHFEMCTGRGNWRKDRLLESVIAHQASYFTIHGFPDVVLKEHEKEVREMNLRLGYRFVLKEATFPDEVKAGERFEIASTWVNAGVAPLPFNVRAALTWSLVADDGAVVWSVTDPKFDLASLPPTLEAGEQPRTARTPCRWGHRAPIPPWNDQVLQVLRGQGRVKETAFDMLAPGIYTLCVSVGSPQGTPEIALPLPNGKNRRYPLGKVTVKR
ncbi:MAG: DUF4832 domain-containing protein [Kiritimatiellae bacterium]|nr:DUF4832 domain-containing protein [Kiritimatiellia bacterium]